MNKIIILYLFFFHVLTVLYQNDLNGQTRSVAKSAEDICPIKVGQKIPSAHLRGINGNEIDIKDIVSGKSAIIIFYRGGWCPYCNMQLSQLAKIEDSLISLGYKILAVSMDNLEHLKETNDKYRLKYELYSDSKANASAAFGIAFKVDDEYVNKLKNHSLDIEAASGETHHILPVPSVFIVDGKGIIQFEYVNPDYKVRLNSDLFLKAAQIYKQ